MSLDVRDAEVSVSPFTFESLSIDGHGAEALALHQRARAALPEAHSHHLLPKEKAQLFPETGTTLGCFKDGVLQGFLVVQKQADVQAAAAHGFLTCPDIAAKKPPVFEGGPIWILQAVCVDPTAEGQGIFGRMIRHVRAKAEKAGVAALMAQASLSNHASWRSFMHQQFVMAATWMGGDQRQRVLMIHPIKAPVTTQQDAEVELLFPLRPLPVVAGKKKTCGGWSPEEETSLSAKLETMMAAGYRGVGADKTSARIMLKLSVLSL